MEIKEAQQEVDKIIKHYGEYWNPLSMLARLVEEVGELSRAINIKYGEKKAKNNLDGREIEKELSDVLFTVLAISNAQKINIEKELKEKIKSDYVKMKGVYIK